VSTILGVVQNLRIRLRKRLKRNKPGALAVPEAINECSKASIKFKRMQPNGYGRTTMTDLTWALAA